MNLVQKLRQLERAARENKNPLQVQRDWPMIERLLMRTPASPGAVDEAVKNQDVDGLSAILDKLEGKTAEPAEAKPAVDPDAFGHDDKAAALRAFKKRLKLARLSDESRLGGRYTSGGKSSKIDAIQPPTDYPPAMWKALAAEGRLKDTGQGFYALP
ncbi:MAG: hypothetical protein AAFR38_14490 [Planctomycetota bacterium]